MKKYSVWVSNADNLADIMELNHDLISYEGLLWDDALKLVKTSLEQGFLCVIAQVERQVG